MTGPQGMGPLMSALDLGNYDVLLSTLGAIFEIKPLSSIPTFTAWETFQDAVNGDIAALTAKGPVYFRMWTNESGNAETNYATLMGHTEFEAIFDILPTTIVSYTAWETRATAYSTDMAATSSKGAPYFKMWVDESGNVGTYDDIFDDTQLGAIIDIEAVIT